MNKEFKPPWEREVAPFCPFDDENLGHDGYHSQMCRYRRFECPIDGCDYQGLYNSNEITDSMYNHLKSKHGLSSQCCNGSLKIVLAGVTEPGDRTWLRFFSMERKKYMIRICKESGTFSFEVQLIGLAWETLKLECSISLSVENDEKTETTTWGGVPRSIREERDICLQLDQNDVAPFIKNDELTVIIAVKSVNKIKEEALIDNSSQLYKTKYGRLVKQLNYNNLTGLTKKKNIVVKQLNCNKLTGVIKKKNRLTARICLKRINLSDYM